MGFLDFFKKKEVVQAKGQNIVQLFSNFQGVSSKTNAQYYTSWVAVAIRVIAEKVATIQLQLLEEDSEGNIEQVQKHPVLELLKDVNPFMSFFYVMERLASNIELQGNEFWFLPYKSGKPEFILPLMPQNVEVIADKEKPYNYVKEYIYKLSGQQWTIPRDQIIHFKQFNPMSDLIGLGTLDSAKHAIETDISAAAYNSKYFQNSARPEVILKYPDVLEPEAQRRLVEAWNENHAGPDKQFKVAVASGGLEIDTLQTSQKEMDFVESRKLNRDEILALFRVPLSIIGITGVSSRAEADAVNAAFMENTIIPKMERIVNTLNEFLLALYPGTENMHFAYKNPVKQDRDLAIREYQTGLASGWLSVNDVRRKEEMSEIQNGESVYIPFSSQPLGTPIEEVKKLKLTPVQKATKMIGESLIKAFDEIEEPKKKEIDQEKALEVKGEMLIKQQENEGLTYRKQFNALLKKLWNRQKKEAVSNLNKAIKTKDDKDPKVPKLLDIDKEVSYTIDLMTPLFKAITEKEGENAMKYLGLLAAGEDFVLTQDLDKFIKQNTKKFAGEVTEQTSNLIRSQVSAGLQQGEGIRELTKRIEDSTAFNEFRAEKIARTETIRAQNKATEEVWKETDVVASKIWYTALDERTCENCGPMQGKEIALGTSFFKIGDEAPGGLTLDYEDTDGPPLHPQCRCTLIPVIKE